MPQMVSLEMVRQIRQEKIQTLPQIFKTFLCQWQTPILQDALQSQKKCAGQIRSQVQQQVAPLSKSRMPQKSSPQLYETAVRKE